MSDLRRHGDVDVRRLTYAAHDGTRVPALLAVPRHAPSRGCLIYQGGIGTEKEQASAVWPGAAALGLTTFTIDPRYTGARANKAEPLERVVRNPDRIVSLLHGSVIDLRRGLDYLGRRRECRHNFGYLGSSLGAALGAMLAGDDRRVRAAVLTSIGATWREILLSTNVLLPGIDDHPRRLNAAVRKLEPFDPGRWVGKIAPRPVMLVNGRNDPAVPPVAAMDLAAAANEPKTVIYHSGGHDPVAGPQGAEVADRIGNFLFDELADTTIP